MKQGRKMVFMLLVASFILGLNGVGIGQEEEKELKREKVTKTIEGEVSGISNNFIAVVYDQDRKTSYEMAFNIGKDVNLEHKKSLSEIGVGDTVRVNYEETIETKKGEKKPPRILNRVVKVIKFIRAAKVISQTSALVSKESEKSTQENAAAETKEETK